MYGYFAAQADGNDVVVYDPAYEPGEHELARLQFPRQPDERRLCIADFFKPVGSGETDYVGLMLATVGQSASDATRELFERDEFKDYLYLHGLSVEMAEALAEHWHHRMRQECGYAEQDTPDLSSIFRQGYRGGRYSWGYPACPSLEEQATVAALLEPERIGVKLTDEFQWEPEQTTAAIVCHHPEAKYFVVRDPRTGKLLRA